MNRKVSVGIGKSALNYSKISHYEEINEMSTVSHGRGNPKPTHLGLPACFA